MPQDQNVTPEDANMESAAPTPAPSSSNAKDDVKPAQPKSSSDDAKNDDTTQQNQDPNKNPMSQLMDNLQQIVDNGITWETIKNAPEKFSNAATNITGFANSAVGIGKDIMSSLSAPADTQTSTQPDMGTGQLAKQADVQKSGTESSVNSTELDPSKIQLGS